MYGTATPSGSSPACSSAQKTLAIRWTPSAFIDKAASATNFISVKLYIEEWQKKLSYQNPTWPTCHNSRDVMCDMLRRRRWLSRTHTDFFFKKLRCSECCRCLLVYPPYMTRQPANISLRNDCTPHVHPTRRKRLDIPKQQRNYVVHFVSAVYLSSPITWLDIQCPQHY